MRVLLHLSYRRGFDPRSWSPQGQGSSVVEHKNPKATLAYSPLIQTINRGSDALSYFFGK